MRRISTAMLVATALAVLVGAGPAAARTTLKLRKTSVGTILVNGRGFTIYAFTKDTRNQDKCQRISGCIGVWPVVSGASKPSLGPGVKASLVQTIILKNGVKQLTYGGHPLYTYTGD